MGDRANIAVQGQNGDKVFLYTHWSGSELPGILQKALKKDIAKRRWTDHQYLTRIIFCEMVKDDIGGETGYGISSTVGDGDDRVITVDVENQKVLWKGKEKSFVDFIKLRNPSW